MRSICMNYALETRDITKHFVKKDIFGRHIDTTKAVNRVSFQIKKGESFVLAGESGSGKSTIARIILGALKPDSGEVLFQGRVVQSADDIKAVQKSCQMVQQDPYDSINPRMRVADIIAEPLEIHGTKGVKREERIIQVLQEVRLEPAREIARMHPHMLSGGQRQRVVLARALSTHPQIIIADEPVSMLDVPIRAEMLELMRGLQERLSISFLYITHDLATARHFGSRIAILYMGKIVESGPIGQVLLHPKHPYTQALVDAVSEPDPENAGRLKHIGMTDASPPSSGCLFRTRCPYATPKCKEEPKLERNDKVDVACFFPL